LIISYSDRLIFARYTPLTMEAIYLEDSYRREFDAEVESLQGDGIVLSRTAFYPQSGGQPSDLGSLSHEGITYKVVNVTVQDGKIFHSVDGAGLSPGDQVLGAIDWDRRYRLMRSHTACHILSAIIFQETGARITGNQIDLARSRVDFSLETFDKAKMNDYIERANQIIRKNVPVRTRVLPRSEALSIPDLLRLAKEVPDREMIRIVEIDGVDIQACGGTHVRTTGEVAGMNMAKAENKGKSNRRVYFEILDGV
jgi:misacylated tRNA(Ala) deacylase